MGLNLEYQVILTKKAKKILAKIKDRREQKSLLERIEKLKLEPNKQGKPLSKDLSGYFSIRAVGQRYRIVYKIDQNKILVIVVGLGKRKEGDKNDVYKIVKKIIEN